MPLIPEPGRPQKVNQDGADDVLGPIKMNRKVKEDVLEAYVRLGGVDFLVDFAQRSPENERVFVGLLARMIPKPVEKLEEKKFELPDVPWLSPSRFAYKDPERMAQVKQAAIYQIEDARVVQRVPGAVSDAEQVE